ncbi:MAG: hypothetical protein AB8I08_00115 [Sandaracinaceae bacterium]
MRVERGHDSNPDRPEPTPEPIPEEPPPPAASPAWQDMPDGFSPVVFPRVADSCEGPVLWVGPSSVERRPPPVQPRPSESGLPELAAGVETLWSHGPGPYTPLGDMSGSHNGPGGEPLFRWHLGMSTGLPVIVFDRRVSRHRMVEVLRGANHQGIRPLRSAAWTRTAGGAARSSCRTRRATSRRRARTSSGLRRPSRTAR